MIALAASAVLALAALAEDGGPPAAESSRGGQDPAGVAAADRLLGEAPRLDRPHVVVIQTDDQDVGSLRVMPNVRELLTERGTTFSNYFATYPLCCPSRSTLLTGEYSHNHGVVSNTGPRGGFDALDHERTLPVWLSAAGYRTAHVGKYMNGYAKEASRTIPPGWDEWYTAVGGGHMYDYRMVEKGPTDSAPRRVEYGSDTEDYQTDVFADRAVDFVERSADGPEPFFMLVDTLAPHQENIGFRGARNPRPAPRHLGRFRGEPLPRPSSFDERDVSDKPSFVRGQSRLDRKTIDAMARLHRSRLESLLAVDDAVGRIVDALGAAGALEETVIVFTSDNGYLLGEHRFRQGKRKLYEESVRAPLVIRGPGFPAGVAHRGLAGNIDLAPTILELAGARAAGRSVDGRSLVQAAQSGTGRGRSILLENGPGQARGVRTERWSYIEHAGGERELYDMRADPFQLQSLDGSRRHRGVERDLARELARLRDCAGAACR